MQRGKAAAQGICQSSTPGSPCVDGHVAVSRWLEFSVTKHAPWCCLSLNGMDSKEGVGNDSTRTRHSSSGCGGGNGGGRSRWYGRTTSLFFFPFFHPPIAHLAIPSRGMGTIASSPGTLPHNEVSITSTMRSSSGGGDGDGGSSLAPASFPTMTSVSSSSSISLVALHREQLRVALGACCAAEQRKAERRRKRIGEWRGAEGGGGTLNESGISSPTFALSSSSSSIPISTVSDHGHPCGSHHNSSTSSTSARASSSTSTSSSPFMVSHSSSSSATSLNDKLARPHERFVSHAHHNYPGRPGVPPGSSSSLPISPLSCTASSSSLPLSATTPAWANNKRAKFWTMYVYTNSELKDGHSGGNGSPPFPFSSPSSSEKTHHVEENERERATMVSDSLQAEDIGDTGGQNDPNEAKEKKKNEEITKVVTKEKIPFEGVAADSLSSALLQKETTKVRPSSPSPSPSSSSVRLHGRKNRSRRERRRECGNPSVLYHNKYKQEVAKALSAVMDEDPVVGQQVLENLSADIRRLLLVMGTASEFYGEDYRQIADQVLQADRDRDRTISSTEFKEWVERLLYSRKETVVGGGGGGGGKRVSPPSLVTATGSVESSPSSRTSSTPFQGGGSRPRHSPSSPSTSGSESASTRSGSFARGVTTTEIEEERHSTSGAFCTPPSVEESASVDSPLFSPTSSTSTSVPLAEVLTKASSLASPPTPTSHSKSGVFPRSIYIRLLLTAGLPFLAFGLLDNSIFILAGDAIDRRLAMLFGFSSLAAAGFGGVVSGVAGIQVHGLAERWVGKVSPEPPLTTAQRQSDEYEKTYRNGSTIGMVVGLLVGMTPLLLINIRGGGGEDGKEGGNPLEVPVN